MYGYKNSEELAPGKSSGKFGLNSGVHITKFEYNPNGGKDGAQLDSLEITILVEEKNYNLKYFPITRAWKNGEGGGEITDTNSEEYKKSIEEQTVNQNAILSDFVKCFVPEEELIQALSTPIASFKNYAEILERLVKSNPQWNKIPLDLFLQWQFTPKKENTISFLEVPTKIKHGSFICRTMGPGFKEDRTPTHLRYVNEDNVEHIFKRGTWYVDNAYANRINLETKEEQTAVSDMNSSSTTGGWG